LNREKSNIKILRYSLILQETVSGFHSNPKLAVSGKGIVYIRSGAGGHSGFLRDLQYRPSENHKRSNKTTDLA